MKCIHDQIVAKQGNPNSCRLIHKGKGEEYRCGDLETARIYGSVNYLGEDIGEHWLELKYYFFYPFNGNIFNLDLTRVTLSGLIAGAVVGIFNPFVWAVAAIVLWQASHALEYFNKVHGIGIHEGDWEHISLVVKTDATGKGEEVVAAYYAAHANEGQWALPVNAGLKLSSYGGIKLSIYR
jgi:hypothetical protein